LGEESAQRDGVSGDCAVLVDVESSHVADASRANEVAGDLGIGHDSRVIQQSAVEAGVEHSVAAVDRHVGVVKGDTSRHYRAVAEGAKQPSAHWCSWTGRDEREQVTDHLQAEGVSGRTGKALDQVDVRAGALRVVDE
jgi:asparagine synthetase B (glutamine-hydrolysing)